MCQDVTVENRLIILQFAIFSSTQFRLEYLHIIPPTRCISTPNFPCPHSPIIPKSEHFLKTVTQMIMTPRKRRKHNNCNFIHVLFINYYHYYYYYSVIIRFMMMTTGLLDEMNKIRSGARIIMMTKKKKKKK